MQISVKTGFTAIPNYIIRGGHGRINLAVLIVIASHGANSDRGCIASIATIAKEAGCDPKTVRKSIKYWQSKSSELDIEFAVKERFADKGQLPNGIDINLFRSLGGGTKSGRGVLPKTVPGVLPKVVGEEYPYKKNPEEGFANKKKPYLEGDPAWQDPQDSSHWRVKIHTGEWVDYGGNVKEHLEYR